MNRKKYKNCMTTWPGKYYAFIGNIDNCGGEMKKGQDLEKVVSLLQIRFKISRLLRLYTSLNL